MTDIVLLINKRTGQVLDPDDVAVVPDMPSHDDFGHGPKRRARAAHGLARGLSLLPPGSGGIPMTEILNEPRGYWLVDIVSGGHGNQIDAWTLVRLDDRAETIDALRGDPAVATAFATAYGEVPVVPSSIREISTVYGIGFLEGSIGMDRPFNTKDDFFLIDPQSGMVSVAYEVHIAPVPELVDYIEDMSSYADEYGVPLLTPGSAGIPLSRIGDESREYLIVDVSTEQWTSDPARLVAVPQPVDAALSRRLTEEHDLAASYARYGHCPVAPFAIRQLELG